MDEFGQIANLGNAVSEMALPITETKKRKHFAIESTPQNLGKLTSETTFGHSKVVFRPLLRTKTRVFSKTSNGPILKFFFGGTTFFEEI